VEVFGVNQTKVKNNTENLKLTVRELTTSKGIADLPNMDGLDISGWWCDACGSAEGPLLSCGGCHLRTYCNASCQRAAWKDHKALCKVFSNSGPMRFGPVPTEDAFLKALQDEGLPYGCAHMLCILSGRVSMAAMKLPNPMGGPPETFMDIVTELTTHEGGIFIGRALFQTRDKLQLIPALMRAVKKNSYFDMFLTLMVLKRIFAIFESTGCPTREDLINTLNQHVGASPTLARFLQARSQRDSRSASGNEDSTHSG
jgi:hypothetical protein